MECFFKISDGSLSDVIIPSESDIKIEDEKVTIQHEILQEHENFEYENDITNGYEIENGNQDEAEFSENSREEIFDENSENSKLSGELKVRWVKSIRGKDKAFFRGYCYTRNRTNKDTISWSCEDINRHKCPGRIQTKGEKVVKVLNKHTHDEKPIKETIYQVGKIFFESAWALVSWDFFSWRGEGQI